MLKKDQRQLKVGILGAGPIAQAAHFESASKARNVELYAICDVAEDLLARMSHAYAPRKSFSSYDEMLADPELDAVVIATSDSFHVPAALAAIAAGKHVLCEKPLGTSIEEVETLRSAVEKGGRILQVGSMKRFDAGLQSAKAFIDSGMGELLALKAWYCDSTHRYAVTDAVQPLIIRSQAARKPAVDPKADLERYYMLAHGSHLCLGTNVVHYQVNRVLTDMARLLKDPAASVYLQRAETIKKAINQNLWSPGKGYYGQYLYGRNFKSLSPRSEALGEALAVLFDVAEGDRQQKVIGNTPVNAFGIPCIYPQIPGILPYHNKAVWPFVETYWAMASAKAGDETSVLRAISAVYRPAAMFLTNKENFVVSDGDYAGTQINSSNMLWSLSGNIALVYKVLFGIHYTESGVEFKPFVPKALAGGRSLGNYKYRNAILDISMDGFGNKIKSMWLDGKRQTNFSISSALQGKHTVKIILANNILTGKSNLQPDYTTPETPVVTYANGKLAWPAIPGAISYTVISNGKSINTVKSYTCKVASNQYAEYQVAAVDAKGVSSFKSEPLAVIPAGVENITEAETAVERSDLPYEGFSGKGFVEISKTKNTTINIPVTINGDGIYTIDFRYANGNGPINTENKCAIRTLDVDNHFAGTVVFPQRGKGEWSNWGFTNPVKMKLLKGTHMISLEFKEANENMNREINQAMVDYLLVIKIGD